MRKVIYLVATSLDGFIAGPNGEIDWLYTEGDYGMTSFFESIDTVVMGRLTQEVGEEQGAAFFEGFRNIVFSRTVSQSEHPELEYTNESVEAVIEGLRSDDGGKNIWLVGGGSLADDFFTAGLIDSVVVAIHPAVLGTGIRMRSISQEQVSLRLVGSELFDDGLAMISYDIV
jgi:dihydrofolate reductase